jgi:hypothetical protein
MPRVVSAGRGKLPNESRSGNYAIWIPSGELKGVGKKGDRFVQGNLQYST